MNSVECCKCKSDDFFFKFGLDFNFFLSTQNNSYNNVLKNSLFYRKLVDVSQPK